MLDPTKKNDRQEIAHLQTESAVRWTSNILLEVQGNHAQYISPKAAMTLRRITSEMNELDQLLRRRE